jgi:hypothetical protein
MAPDVIRVAFRDAMRGEWHQEMIPEGHFGLNGSLSR